jgi:parallel beta-helix repeat protein
LFVVLSFSFAGDAASLNVINFGARGDAIQTFATTVSNSTLVTLSPVNQLSAADAGKLIELFGVGPATSPTNNQDLIASIISVAEGTNVTISRPASVTATGVNCTYGTQNAIAFQNCINACQGGNNVVTIPPGTYLMVPPQVLASNFIMTSSAMVCPAVTISSGGIEFLGDTPNDTVLMGNGAWLLNNGAVQRGVIFGCVGPVTNNFPLIFRNLTFNGGVQVGNQGYGSGPADPVTGGGWDITHDAMVDIGNPPLHADKQFIDCCFSHWRGEMVKSVVAWNIGFIGMTNCAFCDGDGSGFNYNWTPHVINSCLFSNLNMAMEYYVGSMDTNSVFENSVITNTRIAIVLVGALTNYPSPGYAIINNTISAAKYGICLGPARNVTIAGNTFIGGPVGIATDGYAYQGTDINRDIIVENNQFMNVGYPLGVFGAGVDQIVGMVWLTNTASGCYNFASGYGECSNVVFIGNQSSAPAPNRTGGLDGSQLAGQWFVDVSNDFPANPVNIGQGQLTNTVSYAYGRWQEIYSSSPGGVCLLDTANPGLIPSGAELVLTNAGPYSDTVQLASTVLSGSPLTLFSGVAITCVWSNSVWTPVGPIPLPPGNVRAFSP